MDSRDSKRKLLKQVRGIHGNPERVRSTLFQSHPFFDAEDKAQVKYEMLRRREVQRAGLVETCTAFGFTRESYRHILDRFQREGMAGLFERKPGRKRPLKVTDEVRRVLETEREHEPQVSPKELARRCYEQTGVKLSKRTIYRVREEQGRQKKKTSERRGVEKKGNSFLCWAGEYQQVYERWRAQALAGDGVQMFCDWGMALFSSEYKGGCGRLFMVSRRRASVKAGTFSLGRLLLDLGVVQKGSKELRGGYANNKEEEEEEEEVNVC